MPGNEADPLTRGGQSGSLSCSRLGSPACSPPLPCRLPSHRTLKRKSGNTKRLSPAPQLGPSSDTHTSYYSESVVRESYFGSPRAASLARSSILDDQLHSDPYWGECLKPASRGFASSGNLRSKLSPLPRSQWFPNPRRARGRAPRPQKPSEEGPQATSDNEVATMLLQARRPLPRPPPPWTRGAQEEAQGSSICPSETLLKVSP